MQERVWDRLTAELATTLDLDTGAAGLSPENRLREDLGLSSLRTVDLIIRLEDTFEIAVSDDDLADLITLGDVAALIERLVADQN